MPVDENRYWRDPWYRLEVSNEKRLEADRRNYQKAVDLAAKASGNRASSDLDVHPHTSGGGHFRTPRVPGRERIIRFVKSRATTTTWWIIFTSLGLSGLVWMYIFPSSVPTSVEASDSQKLVLGFVAGFVLLPVTYFIFFVMIHVIFSIIDFALALLFWLVEIVRIVVKIVSGLLLAVVVFGVISLLVDTLV